MMTIDGIKFFLFLENVATDLDIPPSKYQDAVDRYQAVGQWIEDGHYPICSGIPSIYPQGSFRLGTVVRPLRDGVEAEYDIDLVCELPVTKYSTNPQLVKLVVGNRLGEHKRYRRMLDREGKRCWTLKYAETDGVGFHLDVLPAVPDSRKYQDTSIAITNKQGEFYDWSSSNPKGFAKWFDIRNRRMIEMLSLEQKRSVQARASDVYASIDEVPDQLVRTPLQRSIQIMKRHRDVMYGNASSSDYAPISIIITALATEIYQGERDLYLALTNIVTRLSTFAQLVDVRPSLFSSSITDLIRRTPDGKWYIANPVDRDENFADRWHEDSHARARIFFQWVGALKKDFIDLMHAGSLADVRRRFTVALGPSATTRYLGMITSSAAVASSPPKIHISTPAKPWGDKWGRN